MRTQSELGHAIEEAREQTDALFRAVRPDSFYERPIAERHRIVFYLGHVEAFDWNLIGRYALDRRPFHAEFDRLFAFGIDPPPGQLPSDRPSDWPSLAEVDRYNQRVRDEIDELLDEVPEQLLHVAVEHRLMHAETIAYILHQLDYERKVAPVLRPEAETAPAPQPRMVEIPAGTAQLGLEESAAFGWDNEFQALAVDEPAFSMAKHKVTNGEYLEFVRAGTAAPFFWVERAGRWRYRGMFAEIPLPLDWPVYVTHREAEAYAKWRGGALPTEAQFHRAASLAHEEPGANLDFRRWEPVSVYANDNGAAAHANHDDAANQRSRARQQADASQRPLPNGRGSGEASLQAEAPSQLVGNGWEWTSTVFAPFPGFTPFPFYRNYSEPFFDGQHYVLKGASPRTAARLARPSFRNWFRPSYPYIYATFRLVEPAG
ncbi:MAG: SUMF1/EgtB/PvdO family nonheme iron enzyme [Bryobacteraceae bacterium]